MRKLFILVPSDSPTGPIKGAYALANAIIDNRDVTLVSIKRGPGANAWLDPRIRHICLADFATNFLSRIAYYRELLEKSGGRKNVDSLSFCLSADFSNSLCRSSAVIYSSVRGNLLVNYRMDYGILGIPLAIMHLFSLRLHDQVIAMNQSMGSQVKKFIGRHPVVIGNFVDEISISSYRQNSNLSGAIIFIFVGSLSARKQPWLLLDALQKIRTNGLDAVAKFIGSGPLLEPLKSKAATHEIESFVTFHGFVNNPIDIVATADVLVLPSLSEGISRAVLEALYLGIPCVVRDIDGNSELITEGVNGALFDTDSDIEAAMLRAARLCRRGQLRESLLPSAFQQEYSASLYLKLMDSFND